MLNEIVVVFSINDKYVPYLSVVIHSILNHTVEDVKYNFIVLNKDISEKNKEILNLEFNTNCSHVTFIDTSYIIDSSNFYVGDRLTVETYFRLFLPQILTNINKVIYLDCDIIVNSDLSRLWDINIEENLLGATRDCGIIGFCYNSNFDRLEYTNRILKISNIDDYLQAGVLIINLEEFRKSFSREYIMSMIINNRFRHHDQDILNIICESRVEFLKQNWNFVIENPKLKMMESINLAPKWIKENYIAAKKNPYIIHYASELKPWYYPKCEYGNLFWDNARYSVYYQFLKNDYIEYCNKKKKIKNIIKEYINIYLLPIGSKRRKMLKMLFSIVERNY